MGVEEFWEDFEFRIGPFGLGARGPARFVTYATTKNSHVLRLRINPAVKKREVKARWLGPGLIEIEWPRREKAEEIRIE